MPSGQLPHRLVRIIARLNIGGPAIQAITMTRLLEPLGYSTRLIRGRESAGEGNMDYIAEQLGVVPTLVGSMRRDPGPRDLVALTRLALILRRDRPAIVHTHAAKAGTLGRLATRIAFPRRARRPILVHTFHGHSLTGYFDSRTARVFREIERRLGSQTDALVAVSDEVKQDLVTLGVAPADRFTVIPLGFDLSQFIADSNRGERRAAVRAGWGIESDAEVVTLVARLVPIKRVDRFLEVARRLSERPRARFVVVGDGELRGQLVASAVALGLGDRLVWAGFRRDMPDVCFASDVVMLTSDNEGTPVSLIEAQAARVPVVSTDVGGVRSAVLSGRTGLVAAPEEIGELAAGVAALLDDPGLARRIGETGREHVRKTYEIQRLVRDLDKLYNLALNQRRT